MVWVIAALVIGGPVVALLAHEITHLAAARLAGPVDVTVLSWLPFRIDLDLSVGSPPSSLAFRAIAVAPTLVGLVIAVVVVLTDVWSALGELEPYYTRWLLTLDWLLYSHASPTDIRSAINGPSGD